MSEIPQRQSPRGPHQVRTSSSDSDPIHHRPAADRSSPKVGDRRSPRGASHSDPLNQKKLGTRIASLESQLGQAQEELKLLKGQLAFAEAAKKEAQEKLEKKSNKKSSSTNPVTVSKKDSSSGIKESKVIKSNSQDGDVDKSQPETVVFEVEVSVEPKVEHSLQNSEEEEETKQVNASTETVAVPSEPSADDLLSAKNEINMLKAKLEEKEKELAETGKENDDLKKQLTEAALNNSAAEKQKEEMAQNLSQVREELKASMEEAVKLQEKLENTEGAKNALESEMKKLRIQTEQWKKAADAAATVLAGGMEMNGKIPERCGSMDKHFGGMLEPFGGLMGLPHDDIDDAFGSGKRKGSGMKMFGDLWKKKGHQK